MLSDLDIHAIRASRDILQRELEGAGVRFKGRICRCPFHDDKSPSSDIYEKDGVWRFHCFVCDINGDIFDVRARLNKTTVDDELKRESMQRESPKALPQKPTYATLEEAASKYAKVEAVYKYTHPYTGVIELAVIRWWNVQENRKSFTQFTNRDGRWVSSGVGAGKKNPIYNRKRVQASDSVIVVEGEKKVHCLHELGLVATCSPGGAKSADAADWTPIAGKKVILWQDNDDAGAAYANEVRRIARDLGCYVSRVCHENLELPEKGDVCDFVARYGSDKELATQAVLDVLGDARPLGTMGDYIEETERIIMGERKSIPFPWKLATTFSRALMPATVTCVFGPPGSAKTLWLCEALAYWIDHNIKACVYQLEDDKIYHLKRIHAQIAGDARINSNDWIESDAASFRASREFYAPYLEKIGDAIWDAPDQDIDFEMLEKWTEERAKAGYQIIMIDPVTAAQSKDKPWVADQKFIFKVKTIARRYNTRVILVTHPRKGQKVGLMGLDDMAGGAAYQRFSHSVLILERNDKEEEVSVRAATHAPSTTFAPDRIMRIAKARNGPGAGRRIAYQLRHDTMRFEELGIIEKS